MPSFFAFKEANYIYSPFLPYVTLRAQCQSDEIKDLHSADLPDPALAEIIVV